MSALACQGDTTTHGGKIISASSTLFVNGIQVALVGDRVFRGGAADYREVYPLLRQMEY